MGPRRETPNKRRCSKTFLPKACRANKRRCKPRPTRDGPSRGFQVTIKPFPGGSMNLVWDAFAAAVIHRIRYSSVIARGRLTLSKGCLTLIGGQT